LAYWLLAAATAVLWQEWPRGRRVLAGTGLVAAVATLFVFSVRIGTFAVRPTFPLHDVVQFSAAGFNRVAVGIPNASLLTPDLGGVLLEAHLTTVDLAGLCDPTVARLLGRNTPALHDYIFSQRKPTFIRTHGPSLRITRLYDDARFASDYAPLFERPAPDPGSWARLWSDAAALPPWRGDYVRKDALDYVPLATLKARYGESGMGDWEPYAYRDDYLRRASLTMWALDAVRRGADE
jgi:hypothetical protein